MSTISDRLRQLSAEAAELAEAWDGLEAERNYFRAQAAKWAEVVDRQGLSFAESVQLGELERKLDEYAERLPA